MRIAHRVFGFVFLAVFLGTGVYMRVRFPDAFRGDAGMRMMFRSAHIYLLFGALLNLLLGVYLVVDTGWRGVTQWIGSACLLGSPLLFAIAFFAEPAPGVVERPIAAPGVLLAALGVAAHVISTSARRLATPADELEGYGRRGREGAT